MCHMPVTYDWLGLLKIFLLEIEGAHSLQKHMAAKFGVLIERGGNGC